MSMEQSGPPFLDSVVIRLGQAALQASALDVEASGSTALLIDPEARRREKVEAHAFVRKRVAKHWPKAVRSRRGHRVPDSERWAIYVRDQYTCRYAHCQRATVDERVVAALSELIPGALAYERHYGRFRAHPLVWTHLASLEHVVAYAMGGSNDENNLITACSLCNYTKGNVSIETLGWEVIAPPKYAWDGLISLLPDLERARTALVEAGRLPPDSPAQLPTLG